MDKFSSQKILNTLPTKYYIIDLISKEILQTNDPKIEQGTAKCHKQLFGSDRPCHLSDNFCICQQLIENKKEMEFIFETGEGVNKKTSKCNAKFLDENVVIANYIDISDEVKYKKELKINYKRLERAEKLADFGYWEFNIEEQIVVASNGSRAIYGINGGDVLHLIQIKELVLPEFRDGLNSELKNLINNKKPYNVKFKIARANDGEFRTIHSIAEFRDDKNMVFGVIHDITNRIKSEKALEESLKDLKLAQRFAKIGNWNLNPTNDSVNWTEQLFYIFNREPELGFNKFADFEDYFSKENYQQLKALTETAINHGTPFNLQLRIYLPEKSKWIKFICKPDQNPGSTGYFLRGTIQDITQSKEVENELNNSNKLLRTVIDNIPDAIYMKDKNFRKLLANKGDARNCGVDDVTEIIGKSDYDLYPKEVADIYTEDDRKVIEDGEAVENREEFLPANGRDRWVLTSKYPLRNENEIIGLVGIGRDITDLKEQQDKLGLLQQTIEQSPLSIVITDKEGLIEYVNPGFTKVTGYSSEEVFGKNPRILKSGSQKTAYYKNLWETIISGKNWSGEFHNKRKNGTYYWESAVITPILNATNEIKHFVAIKEDITEKKQMIRDLEVAKEKAEESDRLKTLFLANMSHEIRTPLNGILGFSSIICAGVKDEKKLQEFGKIIESSGQRLTTVIDDIIDVSMIQSNQLKLNYETFDINDLLDEMHLIYKNQKKYNVETLEFSVIFSQKEEHSIVFSDKNRLYQVFRNLLDNAFKFTESGFIKFGYSGSTNDELELFVEDTGIGIDESKTNLIFQSFRQADEGNSRKYDGSGLGLAIITGILDKMGGKIGVETELNKGSRFYFSIPRNESKMIIKQKPAMGELEEVPKSKKSKRIVSFEDDKASIEYLKIIVDMMGYQLVNFDYAKEGIEYLKTHSADLVLMDVQLPEMNGYDATRILKANHPEIPIIIQTAFAMKGDQEKAFQAGCDDYLPKPLSLKALKEKIEKLVK